MNVCCPACHQTIGAMRLGVRMTPLKAALVDAIKRAGDIGITTGELIFDLYRDRRRVNHTTIKAHVWQINELLEETGWVIRSDGRQWFLCRRQA